MATTSKYGTGGVAIGSGTTVAFRSGTGKADADVQVLWDFDNDGDFSEPVEDITGYVLDLETELGRDWPSQVHGTVGPGKLRMTLDNSDNRFSYFNAGSPLNQAPFSLDVGRKIRVQATGTANPDPALLVRDRFNRPDGPLGAAETGQMWTPVTADGYTVVNGEAKATGTGSTTHTAVVDAGAADYYVQVTIVEPGAATDNGAAPQQTKGDAGIIFRYQDPDNYSLFRVSHAGNDTRFLELTVVDLVAGAISVVDSGVLIPNRKEITLGVHVAGSAYNAYIEGGFVYSGTALQTDETEVGIHANFGTGNTAPRFDDFHVWTGMRVGREGNMWTGRVTDVSQAVELGPRKLVTINAEGVMADLATRKVKPQGQLASVDTNQSIGETLVKAGQLFPPPTASTINGIYAGIAFGDKNVGAYGYGSDGITALEHCRKVEAVELGFLHEVQEGWVAFHSRSFRVGAAVQATFSDDPNAQFGYSHIEPLDWKKEIVNHVTVGVSADAPTFKNALAVFGSQAAGVAEPVEMQFGLMGAIDPGDLLVVFFTSTIRNANENWRTPVGWTKWRNIDSNDPPRLQIFTKVCDGTEDSGSVTFYADAAAAGGAWIGIAWLIRDWYGTNDGIHVGDPAKGRANAGSVPATILPPWGVTNPTLFLAERTGANNAGGPDASVTDPTYPLGYSIANSSIQEGSVNGFDCAEQHCMRYGMTTVEDPGTFSGFGGLNNTESVVVGIRAYNGDPPEPDGRYLLEFHDTASQERINAIRTHEGPTLFKDEDDAEEYADLILQTYARDRPIIRITFPATINAAYRAQAIRRRLGQRIRLIANGTTGNTTGLGIDGEFIIENIRHRISNAGKVWHVTWELSPA